MQLLFVKMAKWHFCTILWRTYGYVKLYLWLPGKLVINFRIVIIELFRYV